MVLILFFLSLMVQPAQLYIVSPDFPDGGNIPQRCTCDGDDISPTIIVNGIPHEAKSLVFIVEDPDAGLSQEVRWLVWNVPPVETITESTFLEPTGTVKGSGASYRGPCPSGASSQRLAFKVFALKSMLDLAPDAGRDIVIKAMEGNILAKGELVGIYSRSQVLGNKRKK